MTHYSHLVGYSGIPHFQTRVPGVPSLAPSHSSALRSLGSLAPEPRQAARTRHVTAHVMRRSIHFSQAETAGPATAEAVGSALADRRRNSSTRIATAMAIGRDTTSKVTTKMYQETKCLIWNLRNLGNACGCRLEAGNVTGERAGQVAASKIHLDRMILGCVSYTYSHIPSGYLT